MSPSRPVNVAVIGAGPAGIYTADIITKQFARQDLQVAIDLYERLPVPFGLVRYGVAPDHPRIKAIIDALHNVLDRGDIRLVAGVEVGTDIRIETLRQAYDAVILTTGAHTDAPLPIPGVELPGSFGASEFVHWYDAHPDAEHHWPLDHSQVAVIGAGNVALDVARMLTKQADDLLPTDIPDHVYTQLKTSSVTDVHLFARRGPAEAAFSSLELRELDEVHDVDILIDPEDMVFDRSSEELMKSSKMRKQVAEMLQEFSHRDPATRTASRRIHMHFMQAPVRIEGDTGVKRLVVERTRHLVNGTVEGTGEQLSYPVGQVYRAVGYASTPVPGVPFDHQRRAVPHQKGRIIDHDDAPILGLYASGWVKRGPVGLIGSTKSDSKETVKQLLEDVPELLDAPGANGDPLDLVLAESSAAPVDWQGWLRIDQSERNAGSQQGRERIKVYRREELLALAAGS